MELTRLQTFHCADRAIDRELGYVRGPLKQLGRAALKFHNPIAMELHRFVVAAPRRTIPALACTT